MQAESNIEFKYNGKVYQRGKEGGDCDDCVFNFPDMDCSRVMDAAEAQTGQRCVDFAWQEKQGDNKVDTGLQENTEDSEPDVLTWTLDEIQQAYDDWDMYDGFSVLVSILRKQKQGQDPEYQKYLELKAKFGE